MTIETARLILRQAAVADAPDLLEVRNSAFVLRYNPMKPWTLAEMEQELTQCAQSSGVLVLELRETGRVIGIISIDDDTLRHNANSKAVSYYLGEQHAGQGYMSEAMPQMFDYAFGLLGIDLLAARVFAGNTASERLLLRCGMLFEAQLRRAVQGSDGVLYDDRVFSITREEWAAQKGGA